jgi:hypothetical protein
VQITTIDKAYVNHVYLNFTATDGECNLYAYELSIYAVNNSLMFYDSATNLMVCNYSYTHYLNLSNFTDGRYMMVANISDSHTGELLWDFTGTVDSENKALVYDYKGAETTVKMIDVVLVNEHDASVVKEPTLEEGKIDIAPIKDNPLKSKVGDTVIKTDKLSDRYLFTFDVPAEKAKGEELYAFVIELSSTERIEKVIGSEYNAHYVIGNGMGKQWFDCESPSVRKSEWFMNGDDAIITLYSTDPKLECHSIGGLNFGSDTAYFDRSSCDSWVCNLYSACGITDTKTCLNVSGSPSEYCDDSQYAGNYSELTTSCNYCSDDVQTNITTTSCSYGAGGVINTTTSYVDNNYATCCALTNISSDCTIRTYSNTTTSVPCGGYSSRYSSGDVRDIFVDGIVIGGVTFVGFIPMIIAVFIVVGLAIYGMYLWKRRS